MISKQKIKNIHSLELKKFRDKEGLFIGEGPKVVEELMHRYECQYIAATSDWLDNNSQILKNIEVDCVSKEELTKASLLKSPQKVLGIFRKQPESQISSTWPQKELCLMLDTIQDPGNLGTIIRLANWFGINHIICSQNTVDFYSPKVVQATMGAIGKSQIHYCNLAEYLATLDKNIPVYGTFLEGENIYNTPLSAHGIIIMGNEGNGISADIAKCVNTKLYIPPYPNDANIVESLNVSIATAITCSEFRRRNS